MRDIVHNTKAVRAIPAATLTSTGSPSQLTSGDIDLQFFDSAKVVAGFGDIDEMGGSPVGAAKASLKIEHAEDNAGVAGTYENVAAADVTGPDVLDTITNGLVAEAVDDATILEVGYVGARRWLRVSIVATALTNGGPAWAIVDKGHPRHAPK